MEHPSVAAFSGFERLGKVTRFAEDTTGTTDFPI
jgi:hypothetical protein